MQNERLLARAKTFLTIELSPGVQDTWLAEHAERVMRLAQGIVASPELAGQPHDGAALAAAALFHDAGWMVEFRQGRWDRTQLLTRPTGDIQRELGAAVMAEQTGHLILPQSVRLAAEAIRQCNQKGTRLLEARVLAEAEALDEVGTVFVLRQFRHYQAEGRPIQQLVDSWQRQQEYRYWELRLNDGFRFEFTRELARRRLADVDAFLKALARDLRGDDVRLAGAAAAGPSTPGVTG